MMCGFAAQRGDMNMDLSGKIMSSDNEEDPATVVMQTLPPELMAAATEAAAGENAAEEDAAAQPLPRSRRRREKAAGGGFSETQWFMKGAEMDADLLETVDDEEYDRDKTISEDEREGFTLRKDEGQS
jgi:hypothetical protein